MKFFEKRRQRDEIISRMRSYILKKVPKEGIKKIEENRVHFVYGYDVTDEDWDKLADFVLSFPNKQYNRIKKVVLGQSGTESIYFRVEFK